MMGSVAGGSVIPTGGGAVAILIGSIFVAVVCGMIAIEVNRNVWGWMVVGLVGSFLIISVLHAVL
jgi:hypothetical protein